MTPPNVQFIPSSSSATLLYTVSGTVSTITDAGAARSSENTIIGSSALLSFVLINPVGDFVRFRSSNLGEHFAPELANAAWTTMKLVVNGTNEYPLSSSPLATFSQQNNIRTLNVYYWDGGFSGVAYSIGDTFDIYIYG